MLRRLVGGPESLRCSNEGRWSEEGWKGGERSGRGRKPSPVPELYLLWASPALASHELQPGPLGCRGHAEKCWEERLGVRAGGEITGAALPPLSAPGTYRQGNPKRPRHK